MGLFNKKKEGQDQKKPSFLERINIDEPFKHDFGIDVEIYHYNRDTKMKNFTNVGVSTNGLIGGTIKVVAMTLGQINTLRSMFLNFGTINARKVKKQKAEDAVKATNKKDVSVDNTATAASTA